MHAAPVAVCVSVFSACQVVSSRKTVKRAHRLRRPRQFQRVRREGRTYQHRLLRLTAAPNRRRQTRCGIVAGKHLGNAVQRNRARRRVREAVRLRFDQIPRGVDLVFVIRDPAVAHAPFEQVQEAVQHVLRRARLWREPEPPDAAAPAQAAPHAQSEHTP